MRPYLYENKKDDQAVVLGSITFNMPDEAAADNFFFIVFFFTYFLNSALFGFCYWKVNSQQNYQPDSKEDLTEQNVIILMKAVQQNVLMYYLFICVRNVNQTIWARDSDWTG